jgi:hypothetical protein
MGVPGVRVIDLETDTDRLLVDGASSFALTPDDRVVYTEGVSASLATGERYLSTIRVLPADGSSPPATVVEEAGDYSIVAVAGGSVVYEATADIGSTPSLWATPLDGSSDPVLLQESAILVAVSPDGSELLTQQLGIPELDLRVISAVDATELASLTLPLEATGGPSAVSRNGDWVGTTIVAASSQGLMLFERTERGLVVSQTIDVPFEQAPWGATQPTLLPDGSVRAFSIIPPPTAYRFSDIDQARSEAEVMPWDASDTSDRGSTRELTCSASSCDAERPAAVPDATSLYRVVPADR